MSKRLLVFTWNLKKRVKALELACAYLAKRSARIPCVASFQELPDGVSSAKISSWSQGALAMHRAAKQRLGIVTSGGIAATDLIELLPEGVPPFAHRMLALSLAGKSWSNLQLVAVHLPNRRDVPEGPERDVGLTHLADAFHMFWQQRGRGPVVVAGDFNADPFHREVAARSAFWATRDRTDLSLMRGPRRQNTLSVPVFFGSRKITTATQLEAVLSARKRTPLYNPMWQMIPERSRHPRGTFVFHDDHTIVGWHCYDQIIVSSHLAEHADPVRVLRKLNSTWLMTASHRKPLDSGYSDHLPVELDLVVDGAKP